MYVCMYVCILNWPLPIGAFQDQYKQTMINEFSNEHNKVKNPNWLEADQLVCGERTIHCVGFHIWVIDRARGQTGWILLVFTRRH